MGVNFTDIPEGMEATPANFNSRFQELDDAIEDIDVGGALTSPVGVDDGGTGLTTLGGVGGLLVSLTATSFEVVDSGAAGGFLRSNGSTWVRSAIQNGDIAAAMVTQHEASIDHDALTNFVAAEHIDWSITGAETINVDRITTTAVTQHEASINHDALTGFVTAEHVNHASVSISAGSGLSGGGTLEATRTLNIDYGATTNVITSATDGTGITVASGDQILIYDLDTDSVKYINVSQLPVTSGDITRVNITAGAGLAGTVDTTSGDHTQTLSVNAADGVRVTGDNVQLDIGGLTNAAPVALDSLVYYDDNAADHKRSVISSVPLSIFSNDAGFLTSVAAGDITAGTFVAGTWTFAGTSGLVRLGDQVELQAWDRDAVTPAYVDVIAVPTANDLRIGNDTWLSMDLRAASVTVNGSALVEDITATAPITESGTTTRTIGINLGTTTRNSGGNLEVDFSSLTNEDIVGTDLLIYEDGTGNPKVHAVNSTRLSQFQDDLGYGTNVAGSGIVLSTTSATNDTISVDYAGTDNYILDTRSLGTLDASGTADRIPFSDNSDNIVYYTTPQAIVNVTSIAETQITDGSVLARLGSNETITGSWSFQSEVYAAEGTEVTRGTAGAVTLDWDSYTCVDLRNDGNIDTINIDDSSMNDGGHYTLVIRYATGGQSSITFSAVGTLNWQFGTAPTLPTATLGDRTVITFVKTGGITCGFYADAPA